MARGHLLRAAQLVCLSLALVESINPGFVGRITGKGLDYARQEGVAALQKELARLKLPDFSGSFKVKHFGHVDYKFDSLNIRSFQLPSSAIAPVPNVGLKVSIDNAFAELSGNWRVKKKRLVSDHGSFDLKVEGLSISVGLKLGSDSAGRLTAASSACSTHVSRVQVHIHGKWSWLYNLFHSKIESPLRKAMEEQVCTEVSNSISSKLQPYLQTLPVTARIDRVSGIDYSLVGPPVATSDSLDVDLKGEFFSLAHRSEVPFPPPALAFPVDHDRMLYFGISNYLFNTAGYVYYQAGELTYEITNDMIPKESKIRLNTSSFASLVPQIEKLYPNMLMKLKVSPSSAPSLAITPETLSLAPTMDVQAFAILPNSSLAPLFVLDVSSTISAIASVQSNKIVGSLKIGKLQLSLKHSDVGPFSVQMMQAIMNYFASSVLVPQINEDLNPLKMPATDAGETSGENATRTRSHSPETTQHPNDSGRESLRQYNVLIFFPLLCRLMDYVLHQSVTSTNVIFQHAWRRGFLFLFWTICSCPTLFSNYIRISCSSERMYTMVSEDAKDSERDCKDKGKPVCPSSSAVRFWPSI